MTTAISTPDQRPAELLPGYYVEAETGAWLTLPWPEHLEDLPPSLGPGVIRWCEQHLVHHLTGEPWRFTRGQRRFIHLWYAVSSTGRWLYRSGVKRGAKGTGKDPLGAALVNAELCGPVRFAGWDEQGRPIGQRHRLSLVQIAANSETQAGKLLRVANAMVPTRTAELFGYDKGILRTALPDGSRAELLTASEKSSEGDPPTAAFLNESHHMTESSGGHKVADVVRRNVGKSPIYVQARALELTNAHQQGADSVGERSFLAWQAQLDGGRSRTGRVDILYDSREAPPDVVLHDDEDLMRGLVAAYADAPWSDLERLRDEAQDPRTSVADSIRFYLNGLAAAEDAWVDPAAFDACARPAEVVADRERITMFLDCSKSTDATALVAVRVSDGYVFVLGVWQRPRGDRGRGWLAPRAEVDAQVRMAFQAYTVAWFGVDPSPARDDETESLYWMPLIDQWHRDFATVVEVWATPGRDGSAVLFDMRTSQRGGHDRNAMFTQSAMQTAKDIDGERDVATGELVAPATLIHDGDSALRVHAHNAKRRPNQWGVSLGKVNRDSSKLVDLAVTMVGARMGRRLVLNRGATTKQSGGAMWGRRR